MLTAVRRRTLTAAIEKNYALYERGIVYATIPVVVVPVALLFWISYDLLARCARHYNIQVMGRRPCRLALQVPACTPADGTTTQML